ncbi:bacteriocin-like protein [Chryseobacterium sp. JM1]|uniref:bacteriocin-like protein n=1 Tax=Chryseobacterium sp. JM1 TaxID=1233950 RepID=UPI0010405A65|nr:hypothetical protein [Chryseobacterium sp. JM1]
MKNLKKIDRKDLKDISGGSRNCFEIRDTFEDPCAELNSMGTGCYRFNSCSLSCERMSCGLGF